MSDKCNGVNLKLGNEHLISHDFKSNSIFRPVYELSLMSLDNQELGIFPTYYYFFDEEGRLNGKVLGDNQWMPPNLTNPFLQVEKDVQGKFKFTIHGEDGRAFDLEEKSIMGIRNIDLEKYANAEKPQIYIKPEEGAQASNGAIRAFLYDIDNNKIGSLSEGLFHCDPFDNTLMILPAFFNHQQLSPTVLSTNNVFAEKIDGEFKINHPSGMFHADYLNIDYDLLDKILMEQKNDPYCQIEALNREKEALCKELDETSIVLSGQHHSCVSELAKANFAIEPATYDIGTYM